MISAGDDRLAMTGQQATMDCQCIIFRPTSADKVLSLGVVFEENLCNELSSDKPYQNNSLRRQPQG